MNVKADFEFSALGLLISHRITEPQSNDAATNIRVRVIRIIFNFLYNNDLIRSGDSFDITKAMFALSLMKNSCYEAHWYTPIQYFENAAITKVALAIYEIKFSLAIISSLSVTA